MAASLTGRPVFQLRLTRPMAKSDPPRLSGSSSLSNAAASSGPGSRRATPVSEQPEPHQRWRMVEFRPPPPWAPSAQVESWRRGQAGSLTGTLTAPELHRRRPTSQRRPRPSRSARPAARLGAAMLVALAGESAVIFTSILTPMATSRSTAVPDSRQWDTTARPPNQAPCATDEITTLARTPAAPRSIRYPLAA
jgi:hypothetical protein